MVFTQKSFDSGFEKQQSKILDDLDNSKEQQNTRNQSLKETTKIFNGFENANKVCKMK